MALKSSPIYIFIHHLNLLGPAIAVHDNANPSK